MIMVLSDMTWFLDSPLYADFERRTEVPNSGTAIPPADRLERNAVDRTNLLWRIKISDSRYTPAHVCGFSILYGKLLKQSRAVKKVFEHIAAI